MSRFGGWLRLATAVAVLATLASTVLAEIKDKECNQNSTNPNVGVNLDYSHSCIINEVFTNMTGSWKFQEGTLKNVTFVNCVFTNADNAATAFTSVKMNNVEFAGCRFRSANGQATVFNKLAMKDVLFRDTVWEAGTQVTFRSFTMSGVIFRRNRFLGGLTLTEGESTGLIFRNCTSGQSAGLLPSVESVRMYKLTANRTQILGCAFSGPFQLAAAQVREMEIRDTTFGSTFSCEDPVQRRNLLDATRLQVLNVAVEGAFNCTGAQLRSSAFAGVMFGAGASFKGATLDSVALIDARLPSPGRTCTALSFEDSTLKGDGGRGGAMRNVTVGCLLSLRSAVVEQVAWTNVTAGRTDYTSAIIRQEFLGTECCTVLCGPGRCKCDVKDRTVCPRGSREVRLGARACLLGTSKVDVVASDADRRGDATAATTTVAVRDLTHGMAVRDGVDGSTSASPIYLFSHRTPDVGPAGADVVTLTTVGGLRLTITPGHLVYAIPRARGASAAPSLVAAGDVAVGDALVTANGSSVAVTSSRLSVVTRAAAAGLYAPHSVSGSLVVDGLRVSCYTTAVHSVVAAAALAPARIAYGLWGAAGVRWMTGLEGGRWPRRSTDGGHCEEGVGHRGQTRPQPLLLSTCAITK
ncbi:hypothetical protein MMPV_001273 [Pyropia vietnamensis]